MLIGVQTVTLNAQVTFVNIAVAISALAGEVLIFVRPEPGLRWCFRVFWNDLCMSEVEKAWRCNFGSFWEVFGNGRTDKN